MSSEEDVSNSPDHEMLQDFLHLTAKTTIVIGHCIFYYASTIPIFSILATFQEYKLWKKTSHPMSPFGLLKCFAVHATWMILCLIGALAMLPMWAARGFGGSIEKEAFCAVEKLVAIGITIAFAGRVVMEGEDNIPPHSLDGCQPPAPVFIANHSSVLDVTSLYVPLRRFKWVMKQSVKFIPGPGNICTLAGHIFLQRRGGKNADKSKSSLFTKSDQTIQAGIPMILFPQGTRRMGERLPFKIGAFKIAMDNRAMVVPMSIHIPMGVWNSYYPVNRLWGVPLGEDNTIVITVHKPIQVTADTDIDDLRDKCYNLIYSVLPVVQMAGDNKTVAGKDREKKTK